MLLAHTWPGNIRELSNAIERALIVSDGGLLTAAQLAIAAPRPRATAAAPCRRPAGERQSLADWERQIVTDALQHREGQQVPRRRAPRPHALAALHPPQALVVELLVRPGGHRWNGCPKSVKSTTFTEPGGTLGDSLMQRE